MLPASSRLRASADFTEVLRRGARAGRPTLTVHVLPGSAGDGAPSRAGLVVSKAVGGSVVRHQVARRLRHVLRAPLDGLPAGSRLVVRAHPPAATATSAVLEGDLVSALSRAARR